MRSSILRDDSSGYNSLLASFLRSDELLLRTKLRIIMLYERLGGYCSSFVVEDDVLRSTLLKSEEYVKVPVKGGEQKVLSTLHKITA